MFNDYCCLLSLFGTRIELFEMKQLCKALPSLFLLTFQNIIINLILLKIEKVPLDVKP